MSIEIQLKSSLRDKKKSHAVPDSQTIDDQIYGDRKPTGKQLGASLNTSSMTALHRDATNNTTLGLAVSQSSLNPVQSLDELHSQPFRDASGYLNNTSISEVMAEEMKNMSPEELAQYEK